MGNLQPSARTYPAGVTCWIETTQPDVEAAMAFYGGLFGWAFEDVLGRDAPARYVVATLDGLDVASVSGPSWDARWATYVAVDDADAVADGDGRPRCPGGRGPGGRRPGWPRGHPARPAGCRGPAVAGPPPAGAQLGQHSRCVELQRPPHHRPDAAQRFYESAFGWRFVDQGWGVAIQVPGTATTSSPPSTPTSARGRSRRPRASRTSSAVSPSRRTGNPATGT